MFETYRDKKISFSSLNSISSQKSFKLTQDKSTEDIFLQELKEINEEFGKYIRVDQVNFIFEKNKKENSLLKKKVAYFTREVRRYSKLNFNLRRLLKKEILKKKKRITNRMYTENTQTTEDLQANNIENEKEKILKMYLNTLVFDKLQKYLIYLKNMCFLKQS